MTEQRNDENETLAADIAQEAGAAPAPEGEASRVAELEEQLATAKQETLYALADTQNVRRRMEKELADARAYAATGFARDMLSVADNLARALDVIPAELREDDKMKGLIVGLEATGKELENMFRKQGIEKFVSVGEVLDPNRHQAMVEMPAPNVAPGTIVQEMQAGYMIKDRLLRPALVGVAKAAD